MCLFFARRVAAREGRRGEVRRCTALRCAAKWRLADGLYKNSNVFIGRTGGGLLEAATLSLLG